MKYLSPYSVAFVAGAGFVLPLLFFLPTYSPAIEELGKLTIAIIIAFIFSEKKLVNVGIATAIGFAGLEALVYASNFWFSTMVSTGDLAFTVGAVIGSIIARLLGAIPLHFLATLISTGSWQLTEGAKWWVKYPVFIFGILLAIALHSGYNLLVT